MEANPLEAGGAAKSAGTRPGAADEVEVLAGGDPGAGQHIAGVEEVALPESVKNVRQSEEADSVR